MVLQRSVGDEAGMVVTVTENPRFANRTAARQRYGEQIVEAPATPEAVLVDRLKAQRIESCLLHGISRGT